MQFAIREMAAAFTEETGISCDLVISSSGKLTAQIKEGAPFDIFVSANMKYPEEINASGLALGPPEVYAYGKLVLWAMDSEKKPSLEDLGGKEVRHVALANPETAPYGKAAVEVLESNGLYDVLRQKLVYGESISQVNQFIISRAADMGFTSLSTVISPDIKGRGNWVVLDSASYQSIAQGIVVIRQEDGDHQVALKFYKFVFSGKAQTILSRYGYALNE